MKRLLVLLGVLALAACSSHDRPVHLVSADGATEVVVEIDGRVRLGDDLVGHLDLARKTLTLTRGDEAGRPIDVYDTTKHGGSVIWRGPDYTLRNYGETWSVVDDRDVRVNGAPWGRVDGHFATIPQRVRFVAAISTVARLRAR